MEGPDFEFYSRCIFRTISIDALQEELQSRNVVYSTSDSYYILTLRLRKKILESLNIHHTVLEEINKELSIYEKTKNRSRYECFLPGCTFRCLRHRDYVGHLEVVHMNTSSRYVCQFRYECSRDFPTISLLKGHLSKDHSRRLSSVVINQNLLVNQLITLKCPKTSCGHQSVSSITLLKKHLLIHTDKKEEVQCIFCAYKCNTSGTLKSHFSRKHKIQTVDQLNNNVIENIEKESVIDDSAVQNITTTMEISGQIIEEDLNIENDSSGIEQENSDDIFIKALAITFNTWMNVSGIPYSTVNLIVKEIFRSYERGVEFTKGKIKETLRIDGIDSDKIDEVLHVAEDNDPFLKAKEVLQSEEKRKRFIHSSFPNAEPVTVFLPAEKGCKRDSYQYVPIKKSLKLLLEDETFIQQKLEDPYVYENDVFKDTRDGYCFRENKYFQDNPEAIPLIVFQDELEVCNPLSAAKTRHKINCTYYTSMNIQAALRSKIQSVQLVSLVSSKVWKKHGNAYCNQMFIEDMKKLETKGLQLTKPTLKTVRVGLAYIVGDNLGQHNISEISQSFSSGYICRWCKALYEDVCRRNLCYSGSEDNFHVEEWSVEEYDLNATLAEENEQDSCGIKRHCTFNQLDSFHCVKQMPPCLGHDVFEGVYAYDIQFYLDYLINKEKLIDADTFNMKLKAVKLSERDSKNRPKDFKSRKKGSKFEGTAGSIRVLSRVLGLILADCLSTSLVGDHILKLQAVCELITAPKLSRYEIENKLHFSIIEYLDLRVAAVDDLGMDAIKPKHHYLSHYSKLYAEYGPLIYLWAMRMEAKHTYFKNCIRTSKNFINVAKTCATRHQRAQISYAYNGLFPRKLALPAAVSTVGEIMHVTGDPFLKKFISEFSSATLIPPSIEVFGTKYEPGQVLALKKGDYGESMMVGLLHAIAVVKGDIFFGCVVFTAEQSVGGYYVTTQKVKEYGTWKMSEIADPHPMYRIGSLSAFSFCLHHYVSNS